MLIKPSQRQHSSVLSNRGYHCYSKMKKNTKMLTESPLRFWLGKEFYPLFSKHKYGFRILLIFNNFIQVFPHRFWIFAVFIQVQETDQQLVKITEHTTYYPKNRWSKPKIMRTTQNNNKKNPFFINQSRINGHIVYIQSHNFIIKHNIQDSKQSIIIKINGTD